MIKRFFSSNVTWLYRYFDKNKGLLEIFSFLMVAQSFIYGSDLKDIDAQSVAAFKIVLWMMIFLVILLLQISTAVELRSDERGVSGTIFAGANFMKAIMRLLTLVLLLASVPIFVRQIQASIHNSLFSVFYVSLGLTLLFEVSAYTTTKLLPKTPKG
jgi:magnesium-transporting ATPase (P-type)